MDNQATKGKVYQKIHSSQYPSSSHEDSPLLPDMMEKEVGRFVLSLLFLVLIERICNAMIESQPWMKRWGAMYETV
jgi:hypothetical protein